MFKLPPGNIKNSMALFRGHGIFIFINDLFSFHYIFFKTRMNSFRKFNYLHPLKLNPFLTFGLLNSCTFGSLKFS